jgi:hypothetical protein
MFMPESLADESDRNDFATTARLMCIAHAATACVMALEAWAKFAKPGEEFDATEPPSEAFDRQERVWVAVIGIGYYFFAGFSAPWMESKIAFDRIG